MGNTYKAWIFLAAISLTLIVFGHFIGGREGLLIALMLALGMNSFIYFYEDKRILNLFSGQLIEGQDPYGLNDIVKRLSVKARIPMPQILLVENKSPQALVVGRGVTHGTLMLTSGVFEKLNREEIETLLAYQMACIKNLNTLAYAVGSFFVSIGLMITESLDQLLRTLLVEKKSSKSPITQLFTRLSSPFIGFILRLSVMPSFYYSADELTAQMTGEPKRLAQVLWKMHNYAQTIPFDVPISSSHMFIVNPLTNFNWSRYFHAQPATEKRIVRLIGYYPI